MSTPRSRCSPASSRPPSSPTRSRRWPTRPAPRRGRTRPTSPPSWPDKCVPHRQRHPDARRRRALPADQDDGGLHLRPRPDSSPRHPRPPVDHHVHRPAGERRAPRATRSGQDPPRDRARHQSLRSRLPRRVRLHQQLARPPGRRARPQHPRARAAQAQPLPAAHHRRGRLPAPLDAAAASLFFQLIASRYETGSVIVTSNLAFGQWGQTLGDDIVAAATIDRLVHHATVIALDGESHRTRTHRPPTR